MVTPNFFDRPATFDPQAFNGPFPLELKEAYNLEREQILNALPQAPRLHWSGMGIDGTIIARVASAVVVKYGTNVQLSEAQTMRHVRSTTGVRLPTLYDYWQSSQHISIISGKEFEVLVTYIVMSYIPGQTLEAALPELTKVHWNSIHSQLIQMLEQLHRVQGTKPGPVGTGKSRSYLFTEYGAGPFGTRQDLVDWYDQRV